MIVFFVLASWNLTDGPNTSLGGGWGNIWQCNVDVAVAEKQKHLHMRKEWWKKLFVAGWGLLIGGCVFLFVGGTALKGGSLSELPKTAFFNTFLIRNRSFGGWINYLRLAWQACTWGHPITFVFCVAGVALLALLKNRVAAVALGGIHHRFAWQAWRLGTSNYLRFAWQACTWGHPITFVFCVAGVALLALLKNPCFMCARAFRPQPFWFIIYGSIALCTLRSSTGSVHEVHEVCMNSWASNLASID